MDAKFMVGTISYLPEGGKNTEKRVKIHRKQLDWLKDIRQTVEFDYYRVESDWCDEAQTELRPEFRYHPLRTGAHYPGYNRNILLEIFYDSDYDWLVCLDDDRRLYPMYGGDDFFLELDKPPLLKMAKEGYLITCQPPDYEPFKKDNYAWEHKETHWYIVRETPYGFLQICFIPNLKKYGYKPIFFNAETACLEHDAPEDTQFEFDWLLAKHRIVRNRNLVMQEIGQTNADLSTIFRDEEHRHLCAKAHKEWANEYLKQKAPRNPEIQTRVGLNRRRNPNFTQLIPRSVPYTFTERDLPRDTGRIYHAGKKDV